MTIIKSTVLIINLSDLDFESYPNENRNPFQSLKQWEAIHCNMEKIDDYNYSKFIKSHELAYEHCDYGVGYYDVHISYKLNNKQHYCRVFFDTIDDGDFGSWTFCESKEEALILLDKIVAKFNNIDKCPCISELNSLFKDIGVYFERE